MISKVTRENVLASNKFSNVNTNFVMTTYEVFFAEISIMVPIKNISFLVLNN